MVEEGLSGVVRSKGLRRQGFFSGLLGLALGYGALATACAGSVDSPDGAGVSPARFEVHADGRMASEGVLLGVALDAAVKKTSAAMKKEHFNKEAGTGPLVPGEWLSVSIEPTTPFRHVWKFIDACRKNGPVWKLLVGGDGEVWPLYLDKIYGALVNPAEKAPTWTMPEPGVIRLVNPDGKIAFEADSASQVLAVHIPGTDGPLCGPDVPFEEIKDLLGVIHTVYPGAYPVPLDGL